MSFWKNKKDENKNHGMATPETEEKAAKKANRKRSKTFGMCLTPEELLELNARAEKAGMSRTDYIMCAIRGDTIVVIEGLPELVQELIRQGNNLNQLAKRMNSRQRVSAEQISLTAYACQAAYMDVVRFVDVWNIKLKKMKKEDDDHADNGD